MEGGQFVTVKTCWQLIYNLKIKLFRENLTDSQTPTYKETRYIQLKQDT